MSKRTSGIVLILISAFLYGIRYLSAAILGSNAQGWSEEFFNALLSYVGDEIIFYTAVALILGVVYLVWSEVEEFLEKKPWEKKDAQK